MWGWIPARVRINTCTEVDNSTSASGNAFLNNAATATGYTLEIDTESHNCNIPTKDIAIRTMSLLEFIEDVVEDDAMGVNSWDNIECRKSVTILRATGLILG